MSVRHRSKRWALSSFFAPATSPADCVASCMREQRERHELDEIRFIVDDQYERWRHGISLNARFSATQRSGSRNTMRNRLPPLVRGSYRRVAPLVCASSRARNRPRPVPRSLPVKNGSKMRSRCCGAMPGPRSATSRKGRAVEASRPTRSSMTSAPASLAPYLTAFSHRFQTIWRSCEGSTWISTSPSSEDDREPRRVDLHGGAEFLAKSREPGAEDQALGARVLAARHRHARSR